MTQALRATAAAALLAGAAAGRAWADDVPVFDTGVDGAGNVLAPGTADPHWSIVQVPAGSSFRPPAPAVVAWPHPAYLANDPVGRPGSSWIAPSQDTDGFHAPGTYVYRTTFDLTGLDPSTASLAGSFATDNSVQDVLVNGVSLGVSGGSFQGFFVSFTATSGFQDGVNTLDVLVLNAGGSANPHGLRVRIDGTADPAVPADTTAPVLSGIADVAFEFTGGAIALDAASLGISAADDVDGAVAVTLSPSSVTDLGTHTVTATAVDAAGNVATATFTASVVDTTAPAVVSIETDSEPVRHGWCVLQQVTLKVVAEDAADAAPSSRIVAVQSEDDRWWRGCGRRFSDWEITGDLTVLLRNDRWGRWSGRTFEITVETTDASGNVATSNVEVGLGRDRFSGWLRGRSCRR